MPESNENEKPQSGSPGSETSPPSGQSGEGSALEKTGFKWGSEGPRTLQGKTAQETAQYVQQLEGAVRSYLTASQQQQAASVNAQRQAAAARQQEQMTTSNKQIGELIYSEPEKAVGLIQNQIGANIGAQVGQAFVPLYQMQAQNARELAQSQDKDIWTKYGPEVDDIMGRMPLNMHTPEAYRQAAKIVRANHLDEIVQERAQQVAATAHSYGVESGHVSGSAPISSSVIEKLKESDYGKHLVQKYGERGVMDRMRDMERADGTTPEKFVAMVNKTHVDRNPDKPGEWRTVHGIKRDVETTNAR